MNTYLTSLAKYLLSFELKEGISKVRLAKLIYFTHKGLVQQGLSEINELKFIRMPLGPVPVDFKTLAGEPAFSTHQVATTLSYNKQVFTLNDNFSVENDPRYKYVKNIYKQLRTLSTSTLVAESHKEPSWMKYHNGDEYYMEKDDVLLPLPSVTDARVPQAVDNQLLQARLVEGMLDDIVEESTRLEYPGKSS